VLGGRGCVVVGAPVVVGTAVVLGRDVAGMAVVGGLEDSAPGSTVVGAAVVVVRW
jgi:hypothetical protein